MWSSRLRVGRFEQRSGSSSPAPSASSSPSMSPSSPAMSSSSAAFPAPSARLPSLSRMASSGPDAPSFMSISPPPSSSSSASSPSPASQPFASPMHYNILSRLPSMTDLEEERARWASGLDMLEPRPFPLFGGLDSMVA